MIKSRQQKIVNIFRENSQLQKLLDDFDIDFESIAFSLVNTLISFDTLIQDSTVYALSENPEEIQSKPEITQIVCRADNNGDLAGTYFTISSPDVRYYVWYNTGSTTAPQVPNSVSLPVVISENDTAQQIADATATAINGEIYFTATANDDTITVTNSELSDSEDAKNGLNFFSPDFEITVLQDGISSGLSVATLNEAVSTSLGLFPSRIASPHEDFYRTLSSANGTSYVYLLKWIYYCYKYFNEEQFFFNNLLEHFVPEYDSAIISSTTQLKIYFDGLGIILDTVDQKIEELYTLGDPDKMDEAWLQHMAQLLGYQKDDFSIQNISFRELIKNLTEIYRTKGTTYSFSLFFKLLGFNADLREYYWDRDATNPEGFASITNASYLWYLTVQDPRERTRTQTQNIKNSQPVQPIPTSKFVPPKDLRDFERLQAEYSIEQLLGFRESDLGQEDRFTYFKTNFINFRLVQFYNKQDLTAKDTDTILKYVRFLTPIYVSSFVEVVTTPWEDFFRLNNPLANEVTAAGDPGNPLWVDILLPFLFITLKEYIPLNLSPPDNDVVVIAQNAWTDLNSDGQGDSALSLVFGDPNHGVNLQGTVPIATTNDLSDYNNLMAIKVDRGRGEEVVINGATSFTDLVSNINTYFNENNIQAVATINSGDIRITSGSTGTTSKIYLLDAENKDIFGALGTVPDNPVDGQLGTSGYQEFGLSFGSASDPTGLSTTSTYRFFVNINTTDFIEVDVSGSDPANTTPEEVRDAINNNYDLNKTTAFVQTTPVSTISTTKLTNGKVVIFYKDENSFNGRLVIMNPDGSIFRAGLNATLTNLSTATIAASKDESIERFFVAYHDTTNDLTKWTVFDNTGNKIIPDKELEPGSTGVEDLKAITLSNNTIAVAYKTSNSGGRLKIIDISGTPADLHTCDWRDDEVVSFDLATSGDNVVVTGSEASPGGAYIVYIENDCTFLINNDRTDSTFSWTIRQVEQLNVEEITYNGGPASFIVYREDNTASDKYEGYTVIYDDTGNVIDGESILIDEDLELISTTVGYNGNIIIAYEKASDNELYYIVSSPEREITKKEASLYSDTTFTEFEISTLEDGNLALSMAFTNRGLFHILRNFGEIASLTTNNELLMRSTNAGDAWDDDVDNYAIASDQGHYFEIDGAAFESDNYYQYYAGLGIDFTDERNRWNTHFTTSPDDDLIPLIQDTVTLLINVLVGVQDTPVDRVDKAGFYIKRNNYISRAHNVLVRGNSRLAHYTRHQDISAPLKVDPERTYKETKWPSWNKENVDYEDWSSFVMALDRFGPSIDWPAYEATGALQLQATTPVQYGPFEIFVYSLPSASTVYFLIEGNITDNEGLATITFTTTGVFPSNAEIVFINEDGLLESVPTERPNPNTLVAIVDHLSLWGIINSDEPAANVSVLVSGAQTQTIRKFTTVRPTAITTGGTSQYGPFQAFTYSVITAAITLNGTADSSSGFDYIYTATPIAIDISGSGDADYTQMYLWTPTDPRKMTLSADPVDIDDISAFYESTGGIIITGAADTSGAADYIASGGIIVSGTPIVEVNYIHPEIALVAVLSGTAQAELGSKYVVSGGMTIAGEPIVIVDRTVEVTPIEITLIGDVNGDLEFEYLATAGVLLSGESEMQSEFERDAVVTPINLSGDADIEIDINVKSSGTAIIRKTEANIEINAPPAFIITYGASGIVNMSGAADYSPEIIGLVKTSETFDGQEYTYSINMFPINIEFEVDVFPEVTGGIIVKSGAEIVIDDGTVLIIEFTASGQMVTAIDSEKVVDITFIDQPTGGMTTDGIVEPDTIDRITADPSGGITSAGEADAEIEITRTATGGIDVLGVSSYQEVGL